MLRRFACLLASLLAFLLLSGILSLPAFASSVQEQADFLAGIPLAKSSVLWPFQNSAEYSQHQKELRSEWEFCRRLRYDFMMQWGRDHLSHDPSTRGIVRYLFGGPDFLNAHAFFPDARIMVLGGLEPVGEVPPPESLSPEASAVGLKALREALHTSLFCGYFITSEMKPQLLEGSFRGVLPVLMTELALTGNRILSVELAKPFGSPGVKILYARFDPRADTQPQTLYYFQADLSNGSECKSFLGWLGSLGEGPSYLKADSFLLPLDSFSETREFLLKTSTLILQDDSGIPFHDFQPDLWKIRLFGIYTDPLPIFKLKKEPGLEAAYHSADYAGRLDFGVGYHVNGSDANLLLATRLNVSPGEIASPSVITPMEALPLPVESPSPTPAPTPRPKPTPKPRPIPVRKALPVEVRKAIPVKAAVEIRKAIPVNTPAPRETTPVLLPQSPPDTTSSPQLTPGFRPATSPLPQPSQPSEASPPPLTLPASSSSVETPPPPQALPAIPEPSPTR